MYFSLLQLALGSRDLSQAEKKDTVVTSSATSQKDNFLQPGPQLVTVILFSNWDKSRNQWAN